MSILQAFFLLVHVIFGTIGLAAFWVPVLTRKGGKNHRLFGKVFKYSAYILLLAAALSLSIRIPQLLLSGLDNEENLIRLSFMVFLAYLLVVVYISMRHGFAVLKQKQDIRKLDIPLNRTLANLAIASSVLLVVFTIIVSPPMQILLYALSPIGVFTGLDIRSALKNREDYRQRWLYEHLGAMLGTGVAFHTAFAVFGANQLFDLNFSGFLQIIPWITPTLIGVPAIALWTRFYKKRYGDLHTQTAKS